MDLTHAWLFVGIWSVLLLVICYILAVYQGNKQRRAEDKEKYRNSPIDVFWRNLK